MLNVAMLNFIILNVVGPLTLCLIAMSSVPSKHTDRKRLSILMLALIVLKKKTF